MELNKYFDCLDLEKMGLNGLDDTCIAGSIICNNVNYELNEKDLDADIAIIGVGERRGEGVAEYSHAADNIRKQLYRLKRFSKKIRITDLGNMKRTDTLEQAYDALTDVCCRLLQARVIPLVLGGSNDMVVATYRAYELIGQIINMVGIDSRIDLKSLDKTISADNFLAHLFCSEPNYLFNYTHIGYQSYFVDPPLVDLMRNLKFDVYRLGEMQAKLSDTEPLIRNADMLAIDMNAVRASDNPCSDTPHGFYGEELCKMTDYAGMSDKLSSIGFYGYDSDMDFNLNGAKLIAHAVWYFMYGFLWRKNDFPYKDLNNYYRFSVMLEENNSIIFYKSKKSERWWMQVPCSSENRAKYMRHYLVPCTYEDYRKATENIIPDRWVNAYEKINL